MVTKIHAVLILGLTLFLAGTLVAQQKPEDIPDAPSATRPIPPPEPPSPRPGAEDESQPEAPPVDNSGAGVTTGSKELPRSTPDSAGEKADEKPAPPPMPPVRTVPAGSVPRDTETGQDLYTITVTTNLVLVPVTVADSQGRLVGGLLPKDFSVLESGQKQTLKFFTSDPFPLSAAVVIDTGMPDVGLKKVQETLSALQGAFSQFDEVGIYTYSSTVGRVADFTGVGKQLTAILLAARDLSKRDRARRKIIFIISDGREQGSTASYADTLKVLLTQNITVYAVGVEGAAIPVYDKLQRIHLPKTGALMGYSNILPKYVNATGGGTMYAELAQADIERAYARAVGDARNQYTLGYSPKSGIGGYREIEVRVRRPDVKVYAKHG